MPKHVLITMAVAFALVGLIWFGVFVMDQTANQALVASVLTIILVGLGIMYTRSTLRSDHTEE